MEWTVSLSRQGAKIPIGKRNLAIKSKQVDSESKINPNPTKVVNLTDPWIRTMKGQWKRLEDRPWQCPAKRVCLILKHLLNGILDLLHKIRVVISTYFIKLLWQSHEIIRSEHDLHFVNICANTKGPSLLLCSHRSFQHWVEGLALGSRGPAAEVNPWTGIL